MCDVCTEDVDGEAGKGSGTDKLTLDLGGYDCTFVDPVADNLVCIICLSVLCEPHLLSCCGNKVCYKCIEPIKLTPGSSCPHCREATFATMLDKALQRQILNLTVYCSNKDVSCAWTGELRHLGDHVRDKCIYTVVTCKNSNCTMSLQRWQMVTHERDECTARPIELKMERLVEKMEDRLASLEKENSDQRDIIRELQDRLSQQEEKQNRRGTDFEEALEKERTKHSEAVEKLQKEFQEQLDKLIEDMKVEIKAEKIGIVRQLDLLKNTVTDELVPGLRQVHKLNSNTKAAMVDWPVPDWQTPLPLVYSAQFPPCQYIMSGFTGYKSSRTCWFSPPFYSWPGGYKLSLCLSAKGYTDGKSDYMSASVQLFQGEYDDALQWPANCQVTVKLLNWRANRNHLEQAIPINAKRNSGFNKSKTMSPDTSRKSTMQRSLSLVESVSSGQIVLKFASVARLMHNPITQTEYLHDDCLCVRIESVCIKES